MEAKFQTKTSVLQDNLSQLPMMKHFSADEIATKVDTFRKGEKSLFWFLKLAIFGALGYLTWTYVLPPIFQAIGQMLAVAATGVMIIAAIICAPAIIKWIRVFARFLHKLAIKNDPFAQLELERQKMEANKTTFTIAKGKIQTLKNEMEVEADRSQKEAEQGQKDVIVQQGKVEKIKVEMDGMIKQMGPQAKAEDAYVELASKFQLTLNKMQGIANKTQQSKNFVQKYGTRAAIMKKMNQKLMMVETAMDIKISDFDVTVEMLKKDYAFGQKANQATTAAKSAMLFSKGWELEYALEVVTNTIATDIAITAGNLKDIDSLTANYTLDSDELYANMNLIADKIKVGEDIIPSAKAYSNPEYKLTHDDKLKSGGFGDMFA